MLPPHPSDPDPHSIPNTSAIYSIEGTALAQTIVAVHGAPGTIRDFRWLAPAVAPFARVIRIGLTGTTISARTELLRAALVHLDLDRDRPPILLGHSMGGVIATRLAARHPELVGALALIATPGLQRHRGMRNFPAALASSLVGSPIRARLLAPITRSFFTAFGFSPSYPDALLVETLHLAASFDFRDHARNIRSLSMPTMVAWAEDDPLIETRIAKGLAEACPAGPRCGFVDGGHNIQKTRAVEIAEALIGLGEGQGHGRA